MQLLRFSKIVALCLLALGASGCVGLVNKASQRFADNLSTAILNENDPGTVRDGVPSYLLLLDAMIEGNPDDDGKLLSASRLYGSYAGGFVAEPERAKRLALRAFDYAKRATCIRLKPFCDVLAQPFDPFVAELAKIGAKDLDVLAGLGAAWAGRIQQDSGDWNAIADLPKVEALYERILALDPNYDGGAPYMVLGVLNSLRPAQYGGKPELGKQNFEKAIALSQGKNLMAKTLYAQYYARLLFDQELHDRLLNEVLAAAPEAPKLTLMNVLAQERAKALLASGKDYF